MVTRKRSQKHCAKLGRVPAGTDHAREYPPNADCSDPSSEATTACDPDAKIDQTEQKRESLLRELEGIDAKFLKKRITKANELTDALDGKIKIEIKASDDRESTSHLDRFVRPASHEGKPN